MRAALYLKKHKVTRKQAMTMEMMKVPLADAASLVYVLIEARDCRQFPHRSAGLSPVFCMKTLLYLTMAIFMTRRLQEFLARVVRYYGLPLPGPA